jgi:transcriptional regulator with XRE-family HTH domain
MQGMSENPLRKWRNGLGMNLDEACAFFKERGVEVSTAKLSRIERDQSIPLDMLPNVATVTGIPAAELAPDVAKIFAGGPA